MDAIPLKPKKPGLVLPAVDEILKGTEILETNMEERGAQAIAKGILIGKLERKREGKLEGECLLLERQIAKRFGPISGETRARLGSATADQLETWAERILDARILTDIFSEH